MKTKKLILLFLCLNRAWAFQSVDINRASLEQISLLSGVGEKLAQSILQYRLENGRIYGEEDLLKIEGLTPKKFDKFRHQIVFGTLRKIKKDVKSVKLKRPVIPLADLEKKILLAQGLNQEVDDDLKKRSRYAWLPTISAMVDMGKNNFLTEKRIDNHTEYSMNRDGKDIGFGIKATFDLDKLIFNTNELEVEKLSLVRMKKREELIEKIHKSYFHYLRLAEKDVSGAKELKNLELELSIDAAVLDSLSQNAFSDFQKAAEFNP